MQVGVRSPQPYNPSVLNRLQIDPLPHRGGPKTRYAAHRAPNSNPPASQSMIGTRNELFPHAGQSRDAPEGGNLGVERGAAGALQLGGSGALRQHCQCETRLRTEVRTDLGPCRTYYISSPCPGSPLLRSDMYCWHLSRRTKSGPCMFI